MFVTPVKGAKVLQAAQAAGEGSRLVTQTVDGIQKVRSATEAVANASLVKPLRVESLKALVERIRTLPERFRDLDERPGAAPQARRATPGRSRSPPRRA